MEESFQIYNYIQCRFEHMHGLKKKKWIGSERFIISVCIINNNLDRPPNGYKTSDGVSLICNFNSKQKQNPTTFHSPNSDRTACKQRRDETKSSNGRWKTKNPIRLQSSNEWICQKFKLDFDSNPILYLSFPLFCQVNEFFFPKLWMGRWGLWWVLVQTGTHITYTHWHHTNSIGICRKR